MAKVNYGAMEVSFLETVSLKSILSKVGGFSKSIGIIFGGMILLILNRSIKKELESSYPDHKE